ncbi:Peroxidasin [Eumeta japonica]|uniref:Hemolin n=1 Tax=Eumeta variegata TaxID=151549 RepID=A0A4C1SVQ2_EUMVA|nr:Peroxidasin [Eumeta japonica]
MTTPSARIAPAAYDCISGSHRASLKRYKLDFIHESKMARHRLIWLWKVTASLVLVAAAGDFTAECPAICHCRWTAGNKAADCSKAELKDVPSTLSNDIQVLDLTGNDLFEITQHAFENVGLNNLKKLILTQCKLLTIHKDGLSGLGIVIELDLSKNDLRTLHPDTFKETEKIRWIFLSDNKLEKLEDGLFRNLPFLQKVELSNNRIHQLGLKTFMNVPKLSILRLDGNKLEHLKVDNFQSLTFLSSLDLHNNLWHCDCYLQPFRDWVISKNLYTHPTSCSEPSKLSNKFWVDLNSDDFACEPNIIYPLSKSVVKSSDSNITLSCKVSGNPLPKVKWVLNSQIIDTSYKYQSDTKYNLKESNGEQTKWLNLTIFDASSTDNGEYFCVAENPGGLKEIPLNLIVTHAGPGVVSSSGMNNYLLYVLIGVSCSIAISFIIIMIIVYCCCRKRNNGKKKQEANGEALIEGSVIPEMEKSLISTVNPVTKPPRRYEVPSVTSGATEMSELNKTLLDNDSVFASNEDDKHSVDYNRQPKRSHDGLYAEFVRQDVRTYPPDLLSFPARGPQVSPAASNASTVPDSTRLPLQLNPASPIHSPPVYGFNQNQNLYRTLPHSRSHSPFVTPMTPPVITPRQGYVTIPRRPRVPSWSSTTSTQILPSSEAQEPLYDNLGLRTTADGSSVLSLNKAGLDQQYSPMRGRPLPATPTTYTNPHPSFYAPIEEQEMVPSPIPSPYTPNMRSSISSQLSNQFSTPGPQEPINPRMSWTAKNASTPQTESRKNLFHGIDNSVRNSIESQSSESGTLNRKGKPETGSLRRNNRETKQELTIKSPTKEEHKNEGNTSLNQSLGTLGKSGKIPPRPPPKPKKKSNADPNEPLFEDEGEDGTERMSRPEELSGRHKIMEWEMGHFKLKLLLHDCILRVWNLSGQAGAFSCYSRVGHGMSLSY